MICFSHYYFYKCSGLTLHITHFSASDNLYMLPASLSRPQEVESFKIFPYSSAIERHSDYFTSFFEQGHMGNLDSEISLTVAQKQKFTIREISPEWGDANEPTKVCFLLWNALLACNKCASFEHPIIICMCLLLSGVLI